MKQFWTKFLILLGSLLSAQTVLAVPLSSLLVVNYLTPTLLIDSSFHQKKIVKTDVINYANNAKISNTLAELFKHKTLTLLVEQKHYLINQIKKRDLTVINRQITATCRRSFKQQKSVYSAIKAQQNSCFHSQLNYQSERKKVAFHIA